MMKKRQIGTLVLGLVIITSLIQCKVAQEKELKPQLDSYFEQQVYNQSGDLNEKPILVLDAAGSYIKTFNQAYDNQLPCIIRFSKRYNLAEETIRKAFDDDCWQKVGTVAKTNKDKA